MGDNHYYAGTSSVDDPLWKVNFEDVYNDTSLFIPWFSILGNHGKFRIFFLFHLIKKDVDYGISPQSQVDYHSPNADRWQMPARYYAQRFDVGTRANGKVQHANFIFLDTSPCVSGYRGDDPSKYTPPPEKAPLFHDNIMQQSCDDQYGWLKGVLDSFAGTHEWVIVVGHHPIENVDVHDFKTLLEESQMSMYLTGHRHKLQAFTYDSRPHQHHIVSGAGCMIEASASDSYGSDQNFLFNTDASAGFTRHVFVNDLQSIQTDFVDVGGNVIFSLVTDNKSRN